MQNMHKRVTVEVPLIVKSPNSLHNEHPIQRAKRRTRERKAVLEALEDYERPTEVLPVVVTLTRYGIRPLDGDNLESAFKAPRDAVASWLGCDDDQASPVQWRYDQIRMAGASSFQLDINWNTRARGKAKSTPRKPDLEEIQAQGEPPVRCIRRIHWQTASGEEIARVPHVTGSNGPGSELVVSKKTYLGRVYLHAAIHFSTGTSGAPMVRPRKRYRTLGVAVFSEHELRALRDACDKMLGDPDVGKGAQPGGALQETEPEDDVGKGV